MKKSFNFNENCAANRYIDDKLKKDHFEDS